MLIDANELFKLELPQLSTLVDLLCVPEFALSFNHKTPQTIKKRYMHSISRLTVLIHAHTNLRTDPVRHNSNFPS